MAYIKHRDMTCRAASVYPPLRFYDSDLYLRDGHHLPKQIVSFRGFNDVLESAVLHACPIFPTGVQKGGYLVTVKAWDAPNYQPF